MRGQFHPKFDTFFFPTKLCCLMFLGPLNMLCASFQAKIPTFYFGWKSWLVVARGIFVRNLTNFSFQQWGGDKSGVEWMVWLCTMSVDLRWPRPSEWLSNQFLEHQSLSLSLSVWCGRNEHVLRDSFIFFVKINSFY